MMRKAPSKQMTAGLILVVILSSSLVIANMIIFSAGAIPRKTDDLLVRLESLRYEDLLPNLQNIAYNANENAIDEESVKQITGDYLNFANATRSGKAVVIAFDDGWSSQYSSARSILEKYGVKVTFFIVCNYVGNQDYMTWRQIKDLQKAGNDIESHTMNHKDLTVLSEKELDYEVGQSKQCLREHGIDSRVFATPFNARWNNETVIQAISKYYDFAKNGNDKLMYLHCDGLPKTVSNQTDCRTYSSSSGSSDRHLNLMNRYSIRTWSHNYYDELYQHNDTKTFEEFVKEVNLPYKEMTSDPDKLVNSVSSFSATTIPVLEYHKVENTDGSTSTSPALLEAEMRYLRDNGFAVLTMSDFRYDENNNYLALNYH